MSGPGSNVKRVLVPLARSTIQRSELPGCRGSFVRRQPWFRQPWNANVTFEGLSADEFAAFNEPGYVKIAWTLRADPITPTESVFRTETRAIATDAAARAKFRRYWSLLSPGIIVIRSLMLQPVKAG